MGRGRWGGWERQRGRSLQSRTEGQGGFGWTCGGSFFPLDRRQPSFFSLYGGEGRSRRSHRPRTSELSATHTHTNDSFSKTTGAEHCNNLQSFRITIINLHNSCFTREPTTCCCSARCYLVDGELSSKVRFCPLVVHVFVDDRLHPQLLQTVSHIVERVLVREHC